jgi:hypothetical protein
MFDTDPEAKTEPANPSPCWLNTDRCNTHGPRRLMTGNSVTGSRSHCCESNGE